MKYCNKCGKELLDEAIMCPGCGTYIETAPAAPSHTAYVPPKRSKKPVVLGVIAVIVAIAVILAVLILPRPNLKLGDLTSDINPIQTLFKLGIPTGFGDGVWKYEDCIEMYGIKIDILHADMNDNSYTILVEGEADAKKITEKIKKSCDYEKYRYSYQNLEILITPLSTSTMVIIFVN